MYLDPPTVLHGSVYFIAMAGTFLLMSYPALKPYLQRSFPTLANDDFEKTVYPVLFFCCIEYICESAVSPLSVALMTACFLATSYIGYLYACDTIASKSHWNAAQTTLLQFDSDADETYGGDVDETYSEESDVDAFPIGSAHSATGSTQSQESGTENEDSVIVHGDEAEVKEESEKSAEEMVEVADNNDVFTILSLSEIKPPNQ